MKKSYRTLEFSFIQDYIKNYCFSEMAKKRIDQIQPFQDIDDLKLYQDDISSAMKIIYAYGRIPLAPYEDIKEILQKAQKGGVCYPQDLLKIVQILKNVQEVQAYLDQEIEQSHLLEILSLLYLPKDLYNEILKCVDPSGNIYDHASHELYRLRRQISAIEANMRKKIEALRAQNKDYLSHDVISTRNDHFVLPVNVSYKNQIKGIHHGHSSSGRTTYVEPEEIVSYNNQLSQIKQDEQLEIHRILLELTKKVRSYDRVLNEDLEIMIEMDAVFAISEYGKKLDMVMPVVDENCQEIELLKARHPLIDQKEVVANDIVLKKPQDILLISGSNTGGKTVALKTAGLLSLMAICGLPIPVTQANLPLFEDVDLIQVGARNMQNFELLKELGKIDKPILLKRGLAATIEEWLMSAEYIMAGGNENVILCERGIRTYETATRNTLDLSAIPVIKKKSHLPVMVDPSHATGIREMVEPLSLAAIAAGADGLMVEVHNDPAKALCDGPQSLTPEQFDSMMKKVNKTRQFFETL